MQTERKFKIEKYLEMARLTRVESKRESFIDMAEIYLESEENEIENGPVVDGLDYLQGKSPEDFINRKFSDCYKEYVDWCLVNSKRPISKVSFSKKVRGSFGLSSKNMKLNGVTCNCFVNER